MIQPLTRRVLARIFRAALAALLAAPAALHAVRAWTPLPVVLAEADAVVLVSVREEEDLLPEPPRGSGPQVARLFVEEVLSGDVPAGFLEVADPRNQDCMSGRVFEVGERQIVTLQGKAGQWRVAEALAASEIESVRAALAALAPWSRPEAGLISRLVPTFSDTPAEFGPRRDLYLVVRNVTSQPITVSIDDWPREAMTWVELEATDQEGRRIRPQPIPTLDAEDLAEFAQKIARRRKETVEPGAFFRLLLGTFDTAAQGWGYRERLRFSALRIERPGTYRFTALVHRLLDARPEVVLAPEPVTLTYEPGSLPRHDD
jgi:hypothetical protein